ncbi:hypothetical protein M2171_005882 [Bradyrhizobium japonicum USDA 38]|nr:hypothetical protein [Bradyrhizobium japonicum USDA 38]MCS3949264.1 hypothetical protein [Bradyrhizobium japonicum]MCW2218050.1 hypothetical protein [Bradyrhizobium japonicum]MCW2342663.1 hypothetical protein [Bradyrhizobium japonicum]
MPCGPDAVLGVGGGQGAGGDRARGAKRRFISASGGGIRTPPGFPWRAVWPMTLQRNIPPKKTP